MRPPLWPRRGHGRAPLGEDQGQGRLPWRQGRDRTAPACALETAARSPCRAGRRRSAEDWLGKWAHEPDADQRVDAPLRPRVRLPEGDIPAAKGTGVSKSAASRRFVALSAERMAEWMAADLSELDLLIIQIDGIHIEEDLCCWPPSASTVRAASIRSA